MADAYTARCASLDGIHIALHEVAAVEVRLSNLSKAEQRYRGNLI